MQFDSDFKQEQKITIVVRNEKVDDIFCGIFEEKTNKNKQKEKRAGKPDHKSSPSGQSSPSGH